MERVGIRQGEKTRKVIPGGRVSMCKGVSDHGGPETSWWWVETQACKGDIEKAREVKLEKVELAREEGTSHTRLRFGFCHEGSGSPSSL